ncbi:MAG: thiamine pyrophosphate-dependent dehydrogenase E1 component subunit alpha [Sandaracinaceae bacterium]
MATPADDPALGLRRVLLEGGGVDPALDPGLGADTLRAMLRSLLLLRRIDERMLAKQRQGKVGFFGTITGQEATPVGVAFATRPGDWVFPALREGGIMLCRGFPLAAWLAQAYGNERDVLKGRQMPSHMSGRSVRQVAWSSCIGPQIPQAVGAAHAARLRGDDTVALGFLGDGATSQPDFHAAMTFAARWRAPAVLICQNNHWSISVPTERQTRSATLAVKARAYGMPGVRVDGNDVLAVVGAVRDAAERARRGDGPTFLEHVTYRMGPHSSSDDPTRYRDAAEVEAWGRKDPLQRFAAYLAATGTVDDAGRARLEAEVDEEIGAALREIEDLPHPPGTSLFDDVYGSVPGHLSAQRDAFVAGR